MIKEDISTGDLMTYRPQSGLNSYKLLNLEKMKVKLTTKSNYSLNSSNK